MLFYPVISFPVPPHLHLICISLPLTLFLSLLLSQGNVTFSCAEPLSVAVTFPGPQSFLQLPGGASSGGVSVGFQFRTWNEAGLLLTFALAGEGGVAWLYLSEATLRLQIHGAGRVLLELSAGQAPSSSPTRVVSSCRVLTWASLLSGSALNDGQWHRADLKCRRGRLSIMVDKEEKSSAQTSHSLPVAIENKIFFGGENRSRLCWS